MFVFIVMLPLFSAAWSCGPPTKSGDTCCFEAIAVDEGHGGWAGSGISCGIDEHRTLHCWGGYDEEQVRAWSSETIRAVAFTLVTISDDMCVLTSAGKIDCRRGGWSQFEGRAIELAGDCALDPEGEVICNDTIGIDHDALPEGEMIALDNLCAIDVDGQLQCWGGHENVPDGQFEYLSTRRSRGCAIDVGGELQCWGGVSTPAGIYDDVSVAFGYTCAVERTSGSLECWGDRELAFGQDQPPDGSFQQVSAGRNHACAIDREGYVHCWGKNAAGEVQPP